MKLIEYVKYAYGWYKKYGFVRRVEAYPPAMFRRNDNKPVEAWYEFLGYKTYFAEKTERQVWIDAAKAARTRPPARSYGQYHAR